MTRIALSLAVAGFMLACSGTQKPKATRAAEAPAAPAPQVVAAAPAPGSGGTVSAGPEAPSSPIYFEFDSDQLTDPSQKTLKQMADYLGANPAATLTVEGHCDETGSVEYNLALGDRRARAAREYLKKLGVDEARMNTISYGEEKPAVAGSDDAAHSKNRRGQFDLKAKQG
jgi:peptidoglycan-associated lipoprotein